MRLPWGGLEREAVGAWDRLAARGPRLGRRRPRSSATRSSPAPRARRSGRALESLGHQRDGSGVEVHLVLSVRDLVRQIPAEWQENVKHRSGMSYARFLARITDPARNSRIASWFWSVQEVPEILDRWGADLPPERIHLVTVPSPGGAPDLLWKRFIAGLRPRGHRPGPRGRAGQPVARRPRDRADPPDQPLGQPRRSSPPTTARWSASCSPTRRCRAGCCRRGWRCRRRRCRGWPEREEAFVAEIERRGYDVVGDLHDLRGNPTLHPYVDPDRPRERDVAGAAVDAIKALLLENARMRGEEARLRRSSTRPAHALPRSYLRPSYRAREKAVKGLARSRVGRGLLGAYRLARGRSSRSA